MSEYRKITKTSAMTIYPKNRLEGLTQSKMLTLVLHIDCCRVQDFLRGCARQPEFENSTITKLNADHCTLNKHLYMMIKFSS